MACQKIQNKNSKNKKAAGQKKKKKKKIRGERTEGSPSPKKCKSENGKKGLHCYKGPVDNKLNKGKLLFYGLLLYSVIDLQRFACFL